MDDGINFTNPIMRRISKFFRWALEKPMPPGHLTVPRLVFDTAAAFEAECGPKAHVIAFEQSRLAISQGRAADGEYWNAMHNYLLEKAWHEGYKFTIIEDDAASG